MHHHSPARYVYLERLLLLADSTIIDKRSFIPFATALSVVIKICWAMQVITQVCWLPFCSDIDYAEYMETYYSVIHFHCKQVDKTETSFQFNGQIYAK